MLPLVTLLLLPATEAAVPAAGPPEVAGVGGAGMAALLSIRMMGGYEDWTPPEVSVGVCVVDAGRKEEGMDGLRSASSVGNKAFGCMPPGMHATFSSAV